MDSSEATLDHRAHAQTAERQYHRPPLLKVQPAIRIGFRIPFPRRRHDQSRPNQQTAAASNGRDDILDKLNDNSIIYSNLPETT